MKAINKNELKVNLFNTVKESFAKTKRIKDVNYDFNNLKPQ